MQKVDLLLVNPGNRLEQYGGLNKLTTVSQPLGLAMLAAYVRQFGFTVAIIDAEAEFLIPEQTIPLMEEYEPSLVGLSAFTTKMTAAGKVLRLYKERNPYIPCIIGGHHSSAIPERTLNEETVDYVVKGEGFIPVTELLRRLKEKREPDGIKGLWYGKNGQTVNGGQAEGIADLDSLPFPAWDLLPMDKYRCHHWQTWDYNLEQAPYSVIYTSLGCPFHCDYCSVNMVYPNRRVRYRSPEKFVAELKILVEQYGVRYVEIIDDTLTVNTKHVVAICQAVIDAGLGDKISAWCFARTDRSDLNLFKIMKRAGIDWAFEGFESGNDTVLQGVSKKQTLEEIRQAVSNGQKAGIHIGGNYVFGLPGDTLETMDQTLTLAKDLNTEAANFFILMPYPGTKLNEIAKEKGYPLPEKWGQYGFFAPDAVPMRNETLTVEQILGFRDNAFTEYYGGKRYQEMVGQVFGPKVLDFIRTEILGRQLVRTPRPERP